MCLHMFSWVLVVGYYPWGGGADAMRDQSVILFFSFVYVACTIGMPSCIKQVKNAVIYPLETDGMSLGGTIRFYLEIDNKYEQIMRGGMQSILPSDTLGK